jgi:hypothetical protein
MAITTTASLNSILEVRDQTQQQVGLPFCAAARTERYPEPPYPTLRICSGKNFRPKAPIA